MPASATTPPTSACAACSARGTGPSVNPPSPTCSPSSAASSSRPDSPPSAQPAPRTIKSRTTPGPATPPPHNPETRGGRRMRQLGRHLLPAGQLHGGGRRRWQGDGTLGLWLCPLPPPEPGTLSIVSPDPGGGPASCPLDGRDIVAAAARAQPYWRRPERGSGGLPARSDQR